jgi:hypothetical protein
VGQVGSCSYSVSRAELIGWCVTVLGSFVVSCCCDTRLVRKFRVRGKSAVGSRYQATASEYVTVNAIVCVCVIVN